MTNTGTIIYVLFSSCMGISIGEYVVLNLLIKMHLTGQYPANANRDERWGNAGLQANYAEKGLQIKERLTAVACLLFASRPQWIFFCLFSTCQPVQNVCLIRYLEKKKHEIKINNSKIRKWIPTILRLTQILPIHHYGAIR